MKFERTYWLRLLGLVFLGGLLAYYIPRIQWDEMKAAFASANFSFLALALPGLLLLWLMRATYLWILLKPVKLFRFWELFRINQIGTMIDQILPARSGYFYRWAILTKQAKHSKAYLASALVASLGIEGLMLIFLTLGALLLSKTSHQTISSATILILGGLLLGSAFFFLSSQNLRRWLDRTPLGAISLIRSIFDVSKTVTTPRSFLSLAVSTTVAWAAQVWIFVVLGMALQLQIGIIEALIVMLVLHLAIVVPVVPGNLGTVQLAIVWSLTHMGFAKEPSIALSIVFHAFHALLGISSGTFFWIMGGSKLRQAFQGEMSESETQSVGSGRG